MSAARPPLDFIARVLGQRGGLCEASASGALVDAVMPPEIARALDLEEACTLGLSPDETGTFAGFGSELLERVIGSETETLRIAGGAVGAQAGLVSRDRARAAYPPLNGRAEIVAIEPARRPVLIVVCAWSAECDEVATGLELVALDPATRAPLAGYAELIAGDTYAPARPRLPELAPLERAVAVAADRARDAVIEGQRDFLAAVARRRRRDAERLRAYFADLRREMEVEGSRRASANRADKLARLRSEEDARRGELDERYRIRLAVRPRAALAVDAPAHRISLRLRRRKGEREMTLHYHPAVHSWEPFMCEGCDRPATPFALCDDAVHIQCTSCRGTAARGGRHPCTACRRKSVPGPPATREIEITASLSSSEPADPTPAAPKPAAPKPAAPRPAAPRPAAPKPAAPKPAAPKPAAPKPAAPKPAAPKPAAPEPAAPEPAAPAVSQQPLLPFAPQQSILLELARSAPLTAREVADRTGLALETVRAELRRQLTNGTVTKRGRTRATRYSLAASPEGPDRGAPGS